MKKALFGFIALFLAFLYSSALAENSFVKSLRTCEKYSQLGGAEHGSEFYNILITLDKTKNGCIYKEKIYQRSGYQMLTCNFEMGQLPKIADSMDKFTKAYSAEVAKNKIYEAKLTSNGEIFENYLINPKYCTVTRSKTK